ncbi:MAG: 1-(5-phosphoribosyl)-5-[(5-phosphoribosylamino)methylideneamino]imidazole-4-carboxamide isomerase [Myxococcota bacterium]
MELIPAIDMLDGKVVRLHRGDYEQKTVYSSDPVGLAERFVADGASWMHVVDLEAARSGASDIADLVRSFHALGLKVQVGGGIRSSERAEELFGAGAERVVIGTSAIRDPEWVAELCQRRPVVVAVDARNGKVAVEGWLEESEVSPELLGRTAAGWGVAAVLFTNILHDGTGTGPDVVGTSALQAALPVDVIASGGIGSAEDIRALREAGVRSCVCGRALLSGALTLDEAFAAARGDRRC